MLIVLNPLRSQYNLVKMFKTCPICGKSEEASKFIGSFCQSCYLERTTLFEIPHEVQTKRCPSCKRVWIGKWAHDSELVQFIKNKVKSKNTVLNCNVDFEMLSSKKFSIEICCKVKVGTSITEQCKTTRLLVAAEQCDECSRKTSGYYEAIVQVRGKEGREVDLDLIERKAQ